MNMKIIRSLLLTLFVFGLAGWIYIALISIVRPYSLSWPLTHLSPWPREDSFGITCFAVSAVSFFFWNIVKDTK